LSQNLTPHHRQETSAAGHYPHVVQTSSHPPTVFIQYLFSIQPLIYAEVARLASSLWNFQQKFSMHFLFARLTCSAHLTLPHIVFSKYFIISHVTYERSQQSSRAPYEGVSKSFRTGRLKRELQMVQLSATRYSCIAIL
jgi:hypothetical protein